MRPEESHCALRHGGLADGLDVLERPHVDERTTLDVMGADAAASLPLAGVFGLAAALFGLPVAFLAHDVPLLWL